MFERCDANTTAIIDLALEESSSRGHNWLGTEHVLLAFLRRRDLLPDDVAALLPDAEAVASALASEATPRRPDAELLKAVGVDLEQVRSAVRRTFGEDVVQRLGRPVHQPWQPWRRPSRRCTSILAGSLRFAPNLKRAFERARRLVAGRPTPLIDPASLLLGMLEVEEALSNRLLRTVGVEPQTVGDALRRHGEPGSG